MPKFEYEDVAIDEGMVYGCIQCYEYQACEKPDYFDSLVHYSLKGLERKLLERLLRAKGLQAPWGYDGHDILD